jgi:ketosteroid isomerase-like protein
MSRVESAARAALAFTEAFNRKDRHGLIKCMSDECRFETAEPAPSGAVYFGKARVSQIIMDYFVQVPDTRLEIEELTGLGERCIVRWTYHWQDPKSRMMFLRGVYIIKVENGLICEILAYVKR